VAGPMVRIRLPPAESHKRLSLGSRPYQAPDCAFELVDNRDKLVRRKIHCCPARTGDFGILPKPRYGLLYLRATFWTNDRQYIVLENTRHRLASRYAEWHAVSISSRLVMRPAPPNPLRIFGNVRGKPPRDWRPVRQCLPTTKFGAAKFAERLRQSSSRHFARVTTSI